MLPTFHQSLVISSLRIPAGPISLSADLTVPTQAKGLILFAPGIGTDRHHPRNLEISGGLNEAGFATLVPDLLLPEEESRARRIEESHFDAPMLSERLLHVTLWISGYKDTAALAKAYLGEGAGAAAALAVAAQIPRSTASVVSIAGRSDLVEEILVSVRAPTLFIVGSEDRPLIERTRRACMAMTCETCVDIVRGASHRFAEPGAMPEAVRLASDWFTRHFAPKADWSPGGAIPM